MPDGFSGRLFRVLGGFVPPPAGVKLPARWGGEIWLNTSFSRANRISVAARQFKFCYRSSEHFVDAFRTLYGPVHKAFLSLEKDQQAEQSVHLSLRPRLRDILTRSLRPGSDHALGDH